MGLCRAGEPGPVSGNIPCEVHRSAETEHLSVTAALLRAIDAAEQASEPALMDCGVSSKRRLLQKLWVVRIKKRNFDHEHAKAGARQEQGSILLALSLVSYGMYMAFHQPPVKARSS